MKKNTQKKWGVWGIVRSLEEQINFQGRKLRFQSAGRAGDKDMFIVGTHEVWDENRVRAELIPYLRGILAAQKWKERVSKWLTEFQRLKAKYVCNDYPMSVHDPRWKNAIGPRYNKLQILLLKSRDNVPPAAYETL
jgi:hypothetical protein